MKSGISVPQFDRTAWLYLLLVLLMLLFSIFFTIYRFNLPTDGWYSYEAEASGFTYEENVMGAPSA